MLRPAVAVARYRGKGPSATDATAVAPPQGRRPDGRRPCSLALSRARQARRQWRQSRPRHPRPTLLRAVLQRVRQGVAAVEAAVRATATLVGAQSKGVVAAVLLAPVGRAARGGPRLNAADGPLEGVAAPKSVGLHGRRGAPRTDEGDGCDGDSRAAGDVAECEAAKPRCCGSRTIG